MPATVSLGLGFNGGYPAGRWRYRCWATPLSRSCSAGFRQDFEACPSRPVGLRESQVQWRGAGAATLRTDASGSTVALTCREREYSSNSSTRRRAKRSGVARGWVAILDTARAIMREEGVAALSMQELARRLDMRAPSLYNYFPGKMAVYDALFRLGFTRFAEYMDKAAAGAQTWPEELRRTFEAHMVFALQNPDLYQLCFERPVPGFVPSEESLRFSFAQLQAGYERARRWRTDIQTDLSPEQITDLVIAMMHGLTALYLSNEPHLPVGQGRFGALIPAMLSVLEKAWSKP